MNHYETPGGTSNIGHRTSDIANRSIGYQTSDIGTSDIRHQTSDIRHRTSNIRTSDIGHQTSNIVTRFANSLPRFPKRLLQSPLVTDGCYGHADPTHYI